MKQLSPLRAPALACLLVLLAGQSGCDLGAFGDNFREASAGRDDVETEAAAVDRRVREDTPPYEDAAMQAYVDRVGRRVAAGANYAAPMHFTVLDTAKVNAYSIAGGRVYVTRGILAVVGDEDELAFVLGHEIGHLSAGHAVGKLHVHGSAAMLMTIGKTSAVVVGVLTLNPLLILASQWGGNAVGDSVVGAVSANYSRQLEFDADQLGISAVAAAGYQPAAAGRLIAAMQDDVEHESAMAKARGETPGPTHGIFDSHPDNLARLAALRQAATTLTATKMRPPEGDYLAVINGLPYGETPSLGTLRGRSYYSAPFGAVLELPPAWTLRALPQQSTLEMGAQGGALRAVLTWHDEIGDGDPRDFATIHLSGATLDRGRVVKVGGLPGWRGSTRYRDQTYQVFSWIDDTDGFLLVGTATGGADAELARNFDKIVASLRPMRPKEASLARMPTLQIRSVVAGDTWARLAANAPLAGDAASDLRRLNRAAGAAAPIPGSRIKLVE